MGSVTATPQVIDTADAKILLSCEYYRTVQLGF